MLISNSKSKQNKTKKNRESCFADIGKKETDVKFQQKNLNSMVVTACQSFQFFKQTNWFLGINRALSKFKSEFCII